MEAKRRGERRSAHTGMTLLPGSSFLQRSSPFPGSSFPQVSFLLPRSSLLPGSYFLPGSSLFPEIALLSVSSLLPGESGDLCNGYILGDWGEGYQFILWMPLLRPMDPGHDN